MHPRAAHLIDALGLLPHPEGGFFREVYRSASRVQPLDHRTPRRAVTTIYVLLASGAVSRWHQVLSDEVGTLSQMPCPQTGAAVGRGIGPALNTCRFELRPLVVLEENGGSP